MSYMLIGSTSTGVFEKTATVPDESPTMSSQVTSSPIEGGGKITDHVVLDPIKFTITGVVASPAEYAALEAMWRGRELLTYRGAEACDNLLITSLKRTRSRDNLGGYGFTIAFQQITITSAVFVDLRAPTMSRQDSGAARSAEAAKSARSATQNGLMTTSSEYAAYVASFSASGVNTSVANGRTNPSYAGYQKGG